MRHRLQSFAKRVSGRVRRAHAPLPSGPRGQLTILLAMGILFGGMLAFLVAGSPFDKSAGQQSEAPVTQTGPAFTYAGEWDMLTLQRHLTAGDVLLITSVPATQGPYIRGATGVDISPASLAVKTTDGQVIKVSLSITNADALSALRSLGYGRLLSSEALTALPQTNLPFIFPAPSFGMLFVEYSALAIGALSLVWFVRRQMRKTQGAGPGGQSGPFQVVKPAVSPPPAAASLGGAAAGTSPEVGVPVVRLADVAGCDEAKFELAQTIAFLKDPAPFHALGARIPRGVMLHGRPGTGKTMLAKAVAAEAGVPFIAASGSQFVEMYVGMGAKRVRELFALARSMGRAVIFIDEFDSLGRARGGPNSHQEHEHALTQLLVELDGFATTDDIVVIAATNRLDILDEAVLRPGRFTRKVHVPLPDVVGREAILAVHAVGKPFARGVDLGRIARDTANFSGAQLADLLNEAAIGAAERQASEIEVADISDGMRKVAVGAGRMRSMPERERSIIAAHEAGHAVCGRVWGTRSKVREISLFNHGDALGYTWSIEEDNSLPSESDLKAQLVALMGGWAAEKLLFEDVTGGASNDFEKANHIATLMVTKLGMGTDPHSADGGVTGRGDLGFLMSPAVGELPAEVKSIQSRLVRALLDEATARAKSTILSELPRLSRISGYLFEFERIDGDTFDALYDGDLKPSPQFEHEWRSETSRPRAWATIGHLPALLTATSAPAPHTPALHAITPPALLHAVALVPAEPVVNVRRRWWHARLRGGLSMVERWLSRRERPSKAA